MHLFKTLAGVGLLTAALSAQNFVLYEAPTAFTSRGNIGTGAGEVLQGFHSAYWRSMGEAVDTTKGKITSFRAVFQDQNLATAEKFKWVVRKGTDAAGPTTGTAGEIYASADMTWHPGTGTGVGAAFVTTTLTTPVEVPSASFFAVGARLVPVAWTSDGHSVHAASQATNDSATLAIDMAWQILGTATSAINPSQKRTWRMGFGQAAAALQLANAVGTATPKYGSGGNFPNIGTDGITARVTAGTAANGQVVALFLSGGFAAPKAIFSGNFALDLTSLIPTPIISGVVAGGTYTGKVISKLPVGIKGQFSFQAILLDVKALSATLSNAVNMTL